jgi:hypothetical protein
MGLGEKAKRNIANEEKGYADQTPPGALEMAAKLLDVEWPIKTSRTELTDSRVVSLSPLMAFAPETDVARR